MRRLSDDAGPARLAGLRDLNPGYFALVMATGIVYRAAYLDRFRLLGRTGQRVGRQRDMVPVVVGTQSVAVAATALPASGALTALAVACWPVGAVLYLGIATLVLAALLLFSAGPAGITSPYWVVMGCRSRPGPSAPGLSRRSSRSECGVTWSAGYACAMSRACGASCSRSACTAWQARELGTATHVSWLVTLGRDEAWVALAAWIAVFAGMAGSLLGLRRRATARGRESGQ